MNRRFIHLHDMSTLLDRTSLPLWVFVVIIVVGSICILATIGVIIRCVVVKRRAAPNSEDEYNAPMRKMTVRRGRVVPQSHYLSLTGSKFGLNDFDAEAANSRSKSPFEWWNKVNKKQNRDSMSDRASLYLRKDLAQSTASLTTPEKEKQAAATVEPIEKLDSSSTALPPADTSPPSSPSPFESPARNHFSRPFHSAQPHSPYAFDKRLSMIQESSPHNSMISTYSRNSRRGSSKMSIPSTDANLTRYEPQRPLRRPSNTYSNPSSTSLPTPTQVSSQVLPASDALMPLAYRGSRTSLTEADLARPSLSHRSSSTSSRSYERHESQQFPFDDRRSARGSIPMVTMEEEERPPVPHRHSYQQGLTPVRHGHAPPKQASRIPVSAQPVGYQTQRDIHLGRTPSKKGNVLRKKSLRKMEMTNMVQ